MEKQPATPTTGHDRAGADGFSIGDAAAMVGVSTHVLRSWERRLSLDLHHRTRSNQRRYRLEDIQRFIAIRQLHESAGLPLVESAAKALEATESSADERRIEGATIGVYWAGLIDVLPEILLVVDEAGRISAANKAARTRLNVSQRRRFLGLAPPGWRRVYESIRRSRHRSQRVLLAVRGRAATVMVDTLVEPIGTRPDGPMVMIGTPVADGTGPETPLSAPSAAVQ